MALLDDKRRARRFYRYFSKVYDFVNPIFYSEEMRRKVVDMANVKEGDLVLEVGCGTGFTTYEIVRRVKDVVAIDITPEQISKAVKRFPDVNFLMGDAENLPFKD
ncbi:MAG: chitin-binding protein, partial [Archaeoglobales archaeon]